MRESSKSKRVYLTLSEQIATGALQPGTRLAAEEALCIEHNVCRTTLRTALNQLVRDRRIKRTPGFGTFVTGESGSDVVDLLRKPCSSTKNPLGQPASAINLIHIDFTNNFACFRELEEQSEAHFLSIDYGAAPKPVAEALGLIGTNPTKCSRRSQVLNGVPVAYLISYAPEPVNTGNQMPALNRSPTLDPVVSRRATLKITAALASVELGTILAVEPGSALVSFVRVLATSDGHGIEYLHGFFRPDRFIFQLDMNSEGPNAVYPIKP